MFKIIKKSHKKISTIEKNIHFTNFSARLNATDKERKNLWPENPTYQVYVPGYHAGMHPASVSAVGRARSVSPEEGAGGLERARVGARNGGGILYAELQFPVTSNYGSMKKRSQRDRQGDMSGSTTATTSVNSGEPSPTNMMSSLHEGLENAVHMASAQSMDSVHRYVPDYVAISSRKTAV